MGVDIFTASGTWTAPSGVTSCTVECWAGGGTGGASGLGRGGGSGGYYCKSTITVVAGNSYSVTVGNAGGDSYFADGSQVYACGGLSPGFVSECTPVGDVIYAGGSGGGGSGKGNIGGGGGGSGPSDLGAGNAGSANSGTSGGAGGATKAGSDSTHDGGAGGGGGTYSSPANGTNGTIPSGGGGGAATGGTAGTGARGQVVITYSGSSAFTCTPVGSLLLTGLATTPILYAASGKLTANGVQVNRTTGTYINNTGALLFKGLSVNRTTVLFYPSGKLLANGIALQRTAGTYGASGKLWTIAGESDSSSQTNAYSHESSGGVGNVTNPSGGEPYLTGIYDNLGGATGTVVSPANSDNIQVSGLFSDVGGALGGVTAPDGGSAQQGFAFDGSGLIGGHTPLGGFGGDSGSDAFMEGASGGGGDDVVITSTETFTPCCAVPPRTIQPCCNCTSTVWDWWQITEVDAFTEAHCEGEGGLGGSYSYDLTLGCAWNTTSELTILGPRLNYTPPPYGYCGGWISYPYAIGGTDPHPSSHTGCCYLDLGGTQCQKNVGWVLACEPPTSSVYTPPLTAWVSPECVECGGAGGWCDPENLIEWGSLEDCEAENGVGNCHCCEGEIQQQFATSALCASFGCTSCTEIIVTPHNYVPPFPAAWYLSYFGPCGCNLTYISTTSDHPLYGFYEPVEGLDVTDPCGTYYYQHWGALDATGPFDCSTGGRFVLMNFVQPVYNGFTGCFTSDIPICNQLTNIWMGRDPVCAEQCNGYNFAPCHPGCVHGGLYATVEPLKSLRQLPTNGMWISPDDNANMLCCTSESSDMPPHGMGMTYGLNTLPPFTPSVNLMFKFATWQGEFLHIGARHWVINFPPLRFDLVKQDDRYTITNGYTQMTYTCQVILDADPLILHCLIDGTLMEINGQ